MSEPYLGMIIQVGFNFAPRGWALCNGQLLSIAQNTALFSLLGTTYGGNGQTTFGLPDLRGRIPLHPGQGPGLPLYQVGEVGGVPTVTLLPANLPVHTHQATFTPVGGAGTPLSVTVNIPVANAGASQNAPAGNIPAQSQQPGRTPISIDSYAPTSAATGTLGGVTATVSGSSGITGGTVMVSPSGNGLPISVQNPYLGVNFAIALQGIFPSRS